MMVTGQHQGRHGRVAELSTGRDSGELQMNQVMASAVTRVRMAVFAISVAVILFFTSPALAQDQKKVNDEANAFKLADVIDASTVDSEVGNGAHMTGLRVLTPQEETEMRKHMREVKKVRLNKIGLARINEERAKKNLKPLVAGRDVDAAPVGDDVELSAPGGGTLAADGGTTSTTTTTVSATVPAYVDNSKLQYFPPIRNQSAGSCAQWSGIYYNMTHEMSLAYGWNAKSGGDYYRYEPMFSYNFVNGGVDNGSWFSDGWNIARTNGIPRWSEFHTTSYKTWCTSASAYRNAITSRTESSGYISGVNKDAGLQLLKEHLNNGHTATYATYVNSWVSKTIANDPGTPDDDAFVGRKIYYAVNGTKGPHGMTIVGYNDNIWCDVNGDGQVTANEKGALRVANSWGTGWNEAGFSWIAYDALRNGIFWYNEVYFVTTRAQQHAPKVVAKITVNHNLRNQVNVRVGTGTTNATSPDTTASTAILINQGGAYAFSGVAPTSQDFTYYLDLSDLAPSIGTAKRWFVKSTDSGSNNGDLTIKNFELYYVNGGTDQIVGVAANTPKVANGNTQYVWIDWTMGDTSPTNVQWATASQTSANESGTLTVTAQLNAASTSTVTVPFTVTGTATGADRTVSASPITIPAGATTGTATITITPDTMDEVNETVILTMGTPTNALPGLTRVYTATITDDDAAPTVAWTAASQASTNESGSMTVTAKLSAVSGKTVTVPFKVTGTSAAADRSISASPITIAAGATTGTATITITADTLDEANETVILTMGTPTNATLGATKVHTATITDDDATPTVAWTTASQSSTNESGTMTVTAKLSAVSGRAVTVPFTVTGTSAAADRSISASPITIAAGATTGTATITITADTLAEPNETVILTIGAPTNATLGATTVHTATITDDDAATNTAPVAFADAVSTTQGVPVGLTLNALDADGNSLAYTIVTAPANGTLAFGVVPDVLYTPDAGFSGTDSFTFKVNDGTVDSNTATVTITVAGINTPPVIESGPWVDTNPVVLPGTTLAHVVASDIDGDVLTYTWSQVSGPGAATFTPNGTTLSADTTVNFGAAGSYTLQVSVSDGAASVIGSVSVQVNAAPPTDPAFQQGTGAQGVVSIEAEHYHEKADATNKAWTKITDTAASGGFAMDSAPDDGVGADKPVVMGYRVNFVKTGTHYIWVRGKAWPRTGTAGNADSVNMGLDGSIADTADKITSFGASYGWSKATMDGPVATINVTSAGVHTVNVFVREDGLVCDKILLTTDANYTPSGTGTAESAQQ